MNLFDEEQILTSTNNNVVVLTTHRIRSNNSYGWSQHSTTSIMIEKVSSIQATYISYPILLVIAGILIVIGLIMGNQVSPSREMFVPIVSILVGVVLVIAYFATRRHVCVIASDGGARIVFETSNMKKEALLSFIDTVEQAKFKRGLIS